MDEWMDDGKTATTTTLQLTVNEMQHRPNQQGFFPFNIQQMSFTRTTAAYRVWRVGHGTGTKDIFYARPKLPLQISVLSGDALLVTGSSFRGMKFLWSENVRC